MPTVPAQTFNNKTVRQFIYSENVSQVDYQTPYRPKTQYFTFSPNVKVAAFLRDSSSVPYTVLIACETSPTVVSHPDPGDGTANLNSRIQFNDKTVRYTRFGIWSDADMPFAVNQFPLVTTGDSNLEPVAEMAWLMVYGDNIPDGYNVTYDLQNCTGTAGNPSVIPLNATVTNFDFTANPGTDFNAASVWIDGSGFPSGTPVVFNWAPETGHLRIGPVTSNITIHVRTYKDPYSPGGTNGPGGGAGTHDPGSSDPIGFNMLPEVSAVGTGFLSLWSPTEQQMLDLSEYMWNANPLTLDFWRRLIADPIQLIYGLNIIPLSLYDAGLIGGTESVVVGMINTGIKMDYLTSQWVELDCGTIDIEEAWGAYLDYDPYTKLDIYLPYIGYRSLRVDDFMPGAIHVKYKIDLLTGACCAQISSTKSDEHDDTLDSVIYQFTGNCATQIPVTATQYADAVRSAISLAAAIGTVALLAGAGAPAAGAAGASIMPGVDPVGLLNSPGMVPVDSELFGTMSQYNFMTASSDAGAVLKSAGGTLKNVGMIHAGASAAENVMGIKPSAQRSGAIGGAAGMLGTQTPYLIFTRPRQAVPEKQYKYTGYPSFMTKQLSELTGFTQIQSIHLEGIPCTANELAEIDALLRSGVIF